MVIQVCGILSMSNNQVINHQVTCTVNMHGFLNQCSLHMRCLHKESLISGLQY